MTAENMHNSRKSITAEGGGDIFEASMRSLKNSIGEWRTIALDELMS